jgi:hypothetical protein
VPGKGLNMLDEFDGPRLDYAVEFRTKGTYLLSVRMLGPSPDNDSVHIGLDRKPLSRARKYLQVYGRNSRWAWADSPGGPFELRIDKPARRVFNIWMREDGVVLDKIVMIKDAKSLPHGIGPPESWPQSVDLKESPRATAAEKK